MGHALTEQHFNLYESVRKWFDNWFALKEALFFWRSIHKLPERWEKYINMMKIILNKIFF